MKLDPRQARHILRQCDFAALATHSAKVPGYPFVSHAPLALDGAGQPLMLLSRLAEHTKNLAADPRASLMVSLPGEAPQAQPRLTLVGDLGPVEVDGPTCERYLRYHPDASTYLGFGDFRFYRLAVQRVRLVAGFAQAGWVTPDELAVRPLDPVEEAALLARLQAGAPDEWRLLGLDWEGLDACAPVQGRLRLTWPAGAPDAEHLADQAVVALANCQAAAADGPPDV